MSILMIHNIEKLTVKVTSKTVPMKKEKEKEKTATERKRDTLIGYRRISKKSGKTYFHSKN